MKRPKPYSTPAGDIPAVYTRFSQDELRVFEELLATCDDADLDDLSYLTIEDPSEVARKASDKLTAILGYLNKASVAETLTA